MQEGVLLEKRYNDNDRETNICDRCQERETLYFLHVVQGLNLSRFGIVLLNWPDTNQNVSQQERQI